jgi:hypothetical protein
VLTLNSHFLAWMALQVLATMGWKSTPKCTRGCTCIKTEGVASHCKKNLQMKTLPDDLPATIVGAGSYMVLPICLWGLWPRRRDGGPHDHGVPIGEGILGKIGFHLPLDTASAASELHNIQCPATIPQKHFSTFIALCYWQLWKRRNGVVFRSERVCLRQVMTACLVDVKLWKLRLPKKDRDLAEVWSGVFRATM